MWWILPCNNLVGDISPYHSLIGIIDNCFVISQFTPLSRHRNNAFRLRFQPYDLKQNVAFREMRRYDSVSADMKFTVFDAALPNVTHEMDSTEISDLNEHCFCGQHQCVTTIHLRNGTIIRAKGNSSEIRKRIRDAGL